MINLKDVKVGDVFSEQSVFVCLSTDSGKYQMKHLSTGTTVTLGDKYVSDLLQTADQYDQEIKTGKEDKYWTAAQIKKEYPNPDNTTPREGDLKLEGIRSVWENISSQVFTVCFRKQGKTLSNKAYTTKIKEAALKASEEIQTTASAKKGVAKTAIQVIEELLQNPILPFEQGDLRILRGVKQQWKSATGFYDVLDIDINEKRQVNLNSIEWIVVNNVKYIVE
jgi:hypothetical protein